VLEVRQHLPEMHRTKSEPMCWPDGICAATPAGRCMGKQIDRHCDMEARRMVSMEPATKHANRGGVKFTVDTIFIVKKITLQIV
jgi:hypothetical protein